MGGISSTGAARPATAPGGISQYGTNNQVKPNANPKGNSAKMPSISDATYSRFQSRLDPRFEQQQKGLETSLANQGFLTGSKGYNEAMGNFAQQRDSAYQDAMDAAVQAGYGQSNIERQMGLQEKLGLGNLGLQRDQLGLQRQLGLGGLGLQQELGRGGLDLNRVNTLGQLDLANRGLNEQQYQNQFQNELVRQNLPLQQLGMLGQSIPLPQFSPNYNLPIAQMIQGQYGNQMGQYGQQQQANQGMWGNLASLGAAGIMAFSSPAYKENRRPVEPVLDVIKDINIEKWNYKPEMNLGTEDRVGPMADQWADKFGGDSNAIDLYSMMGVLMKGMQEITERLDRLEK